MKNFQTFVRKCPFSSFLHGLQKHVRLELLLLQRAPYYMLQNSACDFWLRTLCRNVLDISHIIKLLTLGTVCMISISSY